MSAFTLRRRDRRDAHLCKPHSHRGSRATPFERTKQRHRIVVVIVVELGWAAPSAAPTEFLLFSSGSNPRDAAKRLPSLSFSGASSCPWSFFRSSSKADYYTRTVRCMIGSQNPHQLAPRLCTFGQQSDFHAHKPPKKPIFEKLALKSCILGALRRCLCTEILA